MCLYNVNDYYQVVLINKRDGLVIFYSDLSTNFDYRSTTCNCNKKLVYTFSDITNELIRNEKNYNCPWRVYFFDGLFASAR